MFQTDFAALHYNTWNKAGNSMVIEYSGPNNLQVRVTECDWVEPQVDRCSVTHGMCKRCESV